MNQRSRAASGRTPNSALAPSVLERSHGGFMEFYNLKTKSKVDVHESHVKKQRFTRETSGGKKQSRFALVAEVDGARLFRFVNQDTFDSTQAPELN